MLTQSEPEKPSDMFDEEPVYGDMHKIVLQGIMAAGYLDLKGVKGLFNAACEYLKCTKEEQIRRTSMLYVQKVVRGINEHIKPYNMAIKSACCELTGKKYFVFLITVENSIVKLQMMFSRMEIEIFQKCMDGMLRKYSNFSLPLAECINILRDIDPRASLTQADDFIMKMINLQYFAKFMLTPTEFDVTLGIRGLREFEPLLVDLYRDVVQSCSLCHMILLHGYRCPGPKCKMLLHRACYSKYILTCKQCSMCTRPWLREKEMIRRIRIVEEVDTDEMAAMSLTDRPSVSVMNEYEPPPTPGNYLRKGRHADREVPIMPNLEPMVVSSRRVPRKRTT